MKQFKLILVASILLLSCGNSQQQTKPMYNTTGTIERIDPALDSIIDKDALAEIIAEGFEWSEGTLWIEKENMLLFSDVPTNTVYKWTEAKGKEVYLTPSGYTDTIKRGGETGSNGLLLDVNGNLVLCQHGNRQMAKMDAPLNQPAPKFIYLASTYQGKRFSSPNDAVYNKAGELFFTDPPYGLESQGDDDPKKELPFNGVYKVKTNGEVILLVDSIPRPNGIAFFPGEQQLIIASSDGKDPNWFLYDVVGDSLTNGRLFYNDITSAKGQPGSPDGLKIDSKGNVFATGPGGIWIFNKEGKVLGKLKLKNPTSNCALSADEKTLYISNDMQVLRFRMRK
ncbi:MAG: SMP-30/gluconolactonase/LRE family protein [Lacibacter sp.]|nr:SMP-30/gluconolactonase/LRE family protein [Lacibacter sp.]